MTKLTFKTSISCGGCVAKVKHALDGNSEIKCWSVDTTEPDKTLTVETDTLAPSAIIEALAKLGFKAVLK